MLRTMNRDTIIQVLCAQDYPEFMLEQTADKIERFAPPIAQAFEDWVDDQIIPIICIEGWDYSRLIRDFNMRPVAAFLALDWLTREPEKANACLKRGIK